MTVKRKFELEEELGQLTLKVMGDEVWISRSIPPFGDGTYGIFVGSLTFTREELQLVARWALELAARYDELAVRLNDGGGSAAVPAAAPDAP